jgi:hypothetical protein
VIDTYHLSNLWPQNSGVQGAVIWFSCGEFDPEHGELGPRIRVVRHGRTRAIEITLDDPPRVLGELPQEVRNATVEWVRVNRAALLRHWSDQTDTSECLQELVRLGGVLGR